MQCYSVNIRQAGRIFPALILIAAFGIIGAVATFIFNRKKEESDESDDELNYSTTIFKSNRQKACDQKNIVIVETSGDWNEVFTTVTKDLAEVPVLGLDCEWTSEVINGTPKQRPVALLQLATHRGLCILVRLCKFKDAELPESLVDLLEDKRYFKVGVGIGGDVKVLQKRGINLFGCIELGILVQRHRAYYDIIKRRNIGVGLGNLSSLIIDVQLDKDNVARKGNWDVDELKKNQITYAALDALTGVDIFMELVLTSGSTQRSESINSSLVEFQKRATSMCQGIVDSFKSKQDNNNSSNNRLGTSKRYEKAYSVRNRPLYHNCRLIAPDGQLLCTCDVRKAEWYILKGLGKKINDDPLVVQLNFEPSGRPESDENYYLREKENRCVVCGGTEKCIRKNVIPHEYRKYFPGMMKSHKSHDILLLCIHCHQKSSCSDNTLRDELALKCDAPVGSREEAKFKEDRELQIVRSSARALQKCREKLPPDRVEYLENVLMKYYSVNEVDESILERGINLDTRIENKEFVPHGEKVVKYMIENESLVQFEKIWRKHFLVTMKPKFLPPLWSIDHNHDTLNNLDEKIKENLGLNNDLL